MTSDPLLRLESANPFYLTLGEDFSPTMAIERLPPFNRFVVPQWVFDAFAKFFGHEASPLVDRLLHSPSGVMIQRETFLPRDLGAAYQDHTFKFWVKFQGEGTE